MRRNSTWAGALAGLAVLAAGCATAPSTSQAGGGATQAPAAPAVALPAGVTQAMVTSGRQIYTGPADCSTCHGSDGRGSPLGPNLTDREWLNIDGSYDAIVRVITTGVPNPRQHSQSMPPKGGSNITDEQVRSVAAYVYSISRGSQSEDMDALIQEIRANPRKYFKIFGS